MDLRENRHSREKLDHYSSLCGGRGWSLRKGWYAGWAFLLLFLTLSTGLLFGGGKAEGEGKLEGGDEAQSPILAPIIERGQEAKGKNHRDSSESSAIPIGPIEKSKPGEVQLPLHKENPGVDRGSALPQALFPLEVRDSYNRRVRLSTPPRRVVSCAPNMTEIVFYLGEGKRIVGRTDWCNWPEEAQRIPSVGGLQDPNIERIVQLKPDLVLASSHFQKETVELLESVGIPVYVGLAGREYEEVYHLIRSVGLLLGIPEMADEKVKDMQDQMERIRKKTEAIPNKPRVYYMISFGDEGDYTAGSDTHIAQLIRWAGGRNVGDVIRGWRFSVEGLVKEDPDMILVRQGGGIPLQLKNLSPYKELRAVREGKVYEIDIDSIDRMGPRNVEGLRYLSKVIHPELTLP